ncbi:hypothetical protein SKA53_07976 [Yoonia vestfoldensis SKA53]|uniref:Uncharacterized protein n=1 Tax=Yoonia vestfoldensis SKA53 TaxID=314232 RepID=A3V711_9RHOB|nr:hypothetical protein SKA53_07976 [Yoonia vestfoldensis SKA53]
MCFAFGFYADMLITKPTKIFTDRKQMETCE